MKNEKKTTAGKRGTQEPWFWIIISPLLLVLVACTITISIAVINADDVVVGNYYKQGLAVNKEFSLAENGKKLGLTGTMHFDSSELSVLVDLSSTKTQELSESSRSIVFPEQLIFLLSHPAEKSKDRTIELKALANGKYSGFVGEVFSDRWYWQLSSQPQTQGESTLQWQLSGELKFDPKSNKATFSF